MTSSLAQDWRSHATLAATYAEIATQAKKRNLGEIADIYTEQAKVQAKAAHNAWDALPDSEKADMAKTVRDSKGLNAAVDTVAKMDEKHPDNAALARLGQQDHQLNREDAQRVRGELADLDDQIVKRHDGLLDKAKKPLATVAEVLIPGVTWTANRQLDKDEANLKFVREWEGYVSSASAADQGKQPGAQLLASGDHEEVKQIGLTLRGSSVPSEDRLPSLQQAQEVLNKMADTLVAGVHRDDVTPRPVGADISRQRIERS